MRRSATHLVPLVAALVLGGCGFSPSQPGISGTAARGGGGNNTGTGGGSQTGGGGSTGVSNPDSNCGVVERPVQMLPPEILIVYDASGSMNEDLNNASCMGGCGAMSKWAAMYPALNGVIMQTEGMVNWGLKLFADAQGGCGVSPNMVAVQVAPNNAAPIATALAARTDANMNVSNGSSTPTRRAMDAAVTYLNGRTTANPKFILLATDGQPNCTGTTGNNNTADTQGAIDAVARAMTAGYPTFVVGVAPGAAGGAIDVALTGMANAGGLPRMGTPTYYEVTSGAALASAVTTLVSIAASCTFPVPPPPNSQTNQNNITVWVNGMRINMSATDGWTYGAGGVGSVVINGPMCDQIMAGTISDVKIIFDCVVG